MRMVLSAVVAAAVAGVSANAAVSTGEAKRISEAAQVLNEIHAVPDKDIPQDLWQRAECVVVIPGMKKAAFVVGGEFGKGVMSCRQGTAWSAPIFMEVGKGSWGLQIGAQSTDLVLLIMNHNGVDKLLRDKVSLGAEASIAAGPVGRNASAATDAQLKAEILSYSRSQGLFAGIDLAGGVLRPDKDDNADAYGPAVTPKEVLAGSVRTPIEAEGFMASLHRGNVAATTGTR